MPRPFLPSVLLALFAAAAAPAAMVDAGLSYADAADAYLAGNVPRGAIGGGWHVCAPGATAVISPTGYSTPLWKIAAFSAGNEYGNQGKKDGVSRVGGADIPIDDATLDAWRASLANVRANGALVTPRFAYDSEGISGCEPADFDVMLAHVRQIAGVLNEYADVVVSIECGMIGPWGEMHSSKYDNALYDTRIVRTWLDELDTRIKVQVRSPKYLYRLVQKEVLGTTGNLDGETVLERLDELPGWERIGLFNDGYLGTTYDYGTYAGLNGINNFSRPQAVRWLARVPAVPYGGELASVSAAAASDVFDWFATNGWGRAGGWNVVQEWYDTHLTYLRGIYGGVGEALAARAFSQSAYAFDGAPDLHEWEGRTMSDFMRAHMGHRFVLRSSRLTDSAAPGGTLQLAFSVENTGFGDLFLPTKTEVLLQAADDRFWACPVALDFGAAVPSRTNAALSLSLRLPSGVTNGTWRVYLRTHIPVVGDSPSAAGTRTVRFANADAQWNAALGANLLGSFRVSGAAAQPGLDFRETGAATAGATAPQIVLAALPAGAAPSVPLSEWSGRELCLYAPGAANLRYFHAGAEVPATDGAVAIPDGDAALGLWSVRYEGAGGAVSRDLFVVVPDGWEGRTWRLETRAGRLRAVCDETGEETDPAPGYDRQLPGRAMEGEPATNGKLVFAGTGNEFVADPATSAIYPAFVVTGVPEGGAKLGGLHSVTVSSGGGSVIDSNSSGNMADRSSNPDGAQKQTVSIPADGAYLTDIGFTLVNWISPYSFGTVRSLALNDPSASRGGWSVGLENAQLSTLGLFQSDPGYHVWFCDAEWNVLCEKSGALAGSYRGNFHCIPIPAATNLYDAAAPADRSDDERCRPFRGWKNLDGSAPGWALGSVALVAEHGDALHEWAVSADSATGGAVLRCSVCGRERAIARPAFGGAVGAPAIEVTAPSRFSLRVADAAAGAWYTLFAAPALAGPWTAERASVRPEADGPLVFPDVDATPVARFFAVAVGSASFAAGDALPPGEVP